MNTMTIGELRTLVNATPITTCDDSREIKSGCTCDLLSWVMAQGQADMAWVTVQTHMNVIAVAALHDFACVVLPCDASMPETVVEKAEDEGIAVLRSPLDAFTICGRMFAGGVPGVKAE